MAGQTIVLVVTGVDLSVDTYPFREHRSSLSRGSGSLAIVVLRPLAGCAAYGSGVLAERIRIFRPCDGGITPLAGLANRRDARR